MVRAQARAASILAFGLAVLLFLGLAWRAYDQYRGGSTTDAMDAFPVWVLLGIVLALYNGERYRRRKLEERVKVLENKS